MRRAWGLHAVVVLVMVLTLVILLAVSGEQDSTSFVLALAFFVVPLAAVYAVTSTVLVALLRPGRWPVALAHTIALALGVLATGIWVR